MHCRRYRFSPVATALSGLFLLVFFLCGGAASASVGFQPVSQEELKMTAEPAAPGAPAVILYRQVDRDDNTSMEDNYLRIKILTEEGRKQADIEIPFHKGEASILNLKARTIKPDGTIANFSGTIFEKTIIKVKGHKYQAKTFTLPDVQVGSIIEYFYTIHRDPDYIFDSEWILSQELFTKRARFMLKPSRVMNLRWTSRLPQRMDNPRAEAGGTIRLEVADIPAFIEEDYMPPVEDLKYNVQFIYNDDIGNKPEAFWNHWLRHYYSDLNGMMSDHKAMAQAVAGIVSPDDSPETKARKIYARVQQLRNTSYEGGKTEQEIKRAKEKPPHTIEEVWKNGYGSGWYLTWLYLDMVRAAGLEAYPVLAATRDGRSFEPGLMVTRSLNSNMVLLNFGDHYAFCDPGAAFVPFGFLPWQETATAAVKLSKDGGTWITTALPPSTQTHIERNAKLKLMEESGNLEGTLTVTYTGMEAYARRIDEHREDEAGRKKFLEDEVREAVPSAIEVELTNTPDWRSPEEPLVAEFALKIPGWIVLAGRRALLPVGIFAAAEKHLFEPVKREHPISYHYASTKLDDIRIELPEGWKIASLPEPANVNQPAVSISFKAANENGALHLQRKLSSDAVSLDADDYPMLRNFYRYVRIHDEQQIVLLPAAAAASN
jgi:hypothetical protein